MKRIVLFITSLALGFGAFAQVEQGSIMLGGSIGYTSTENEMFTGGPDPDVVSTDNNELAIQLKGGFFVIEELAVGLNLSYTSNSDDDPESLFGFGVFGRKYFALADRFYLFGELNVNVLTGSTQSDNDLRGWNMALQPGLTFFPADNWGIDFSLNNIVSYQAITEKTPDGDLTDSEVQLGLGLTPTLGIFYFIH